MRVLPASQIPENPSLRRETKRRPAIAAPLVSASSTTQPVMSPHGDAQAMIAHGKELLDQAARQKMLDPMFTRPAPHNSPIHPLARALAAPIAGERQVTDQIYEYTLADGRRFCFTKPPLHALANRGDGPADLLGGVATNCPR